MIMLINLVVIFMFLSSLKTNARTKTQYKKTHSIWYLSYRLSNAYMYWYLNSGFLWWNIRKLFYQIWLFLMIVVRKDGIYYFYSLLITPRYLLCDYLYASWVLVSHYIMHTWVRNFEYNRQVRFDIA